MKVDANGVDAGVRAPFATRGVGAVAGVSALVLVLSATRYGYFGDELYFLAAGRRLSFGYADQGPVLPLIARVMDTIAPGSLVMLRLPAILLTVVAVVLCAAIAWEMGGGRAAQVLAATGYATSPFLLLHGKMLTTDAVDVALWVVISWLVVRWVRTRADSVLWWAVAVTAIDLNIKWLIPFLWFAVGAAVFACGPRALLRRPALWWGALLVALSAAPSLWWQAHHGWPQFRMGGQISGEQVYTGGVLMFVPLAMLIAGILGAILLVYGTWWLLRSSELREYQFLGVALPLLVVFFAVVGGRVYYPAGLYAAVMAAGAVGLVGHGGRWTRVAAVPVIALSVAFVGWSTPWQPASRLTPPKDAAAATLNISTWGQFGWSELVDVTVAAYRAMPPSEQAGTVIITETYWQAAALDQYGRQYGLPPVYSPSRGFGYFGPPPDTATAVLYVGGTEPGLRSEFRDVVAVGKVNSRLGFPGNTQDVTLWRCAEPIRPMSQAWSGFMRL